MPRRLRGLVSLDKKRKTSGRYKATNPSGFYDPFPEVQGTLPEKILFARLMYLRIPFIFQGYVTVNIPDLEILKDYRPDFIIPDIKVIIEVQGAYFHSTDEAIESDAYKFALYQTMGYKVVAWWDYEIMSNLDALFQSLPELNVWVGPRGPRILTGKERNIDDSKGIVTLNKRRAKGATAARVGRRPMRKASTKFTANKKLGVKMIK